MCHLSKTDVYFLPASNVALAIVETFQNEGNIPFFQGIQHTPTFPFDRNQTPQTHVLQMVRGKGLLAAQHVANFGYRKFRMLFEQMNDAQAHRVSYRFEDGCDPLQFFGFFAFSRGAIFVVQYTTWCFHQDLRFSDCCSSVMIRNIQNIRLRKALSFIRGEFGGEK